MSAVVDQWSMLGLGQDQKTEEKDKQGHGKVEDKGKLSPRRCGTARGSVLNWVHPSTTIIVTTHGWCCTRSGCRQWEELVGI